MQARSARTNTTATIQGQRPKLQPIQLPSDRPDWLQSLLKIHRRIWAGTIIISGAALTLYSWSVYSQQSWGQAYRRLDNLQRNERQLISGSEVMKNEIAQQVSPEALGLAPQTSNNVIFLQPDAAPTGEAPNPADQPMPDSFDANAPANRQPPLGY
jgi:hypothetical protein